MIRSLISSGNVFLNNYSAFVLLFPYLIYCTKENSIIIQLTILSCLLILNDYLLLKKLKNKSLRILISTSIIIFFYTKIFFNDTEVVVHNLRFREFLFFFSVIVTLLMVFAYRKEENLRILNVFFLVFGFTFLFSNSNNAFFDRGKILDENNFIFNNKFIGENRQPEPILLIIFDELSSSKEIFKYTKDSIDLEFDIELEQKGFEVFTEFKSDSYHTKFSMPSIFNFNLHSRSSLLDSIEKLNDEVTIQKSFYWLASNNLLIDSLNNKSIKSHSFGLFPFNKGVNKRQFVYWWPSFRDPIRMFSNDSFLQGFFNNTILQPFESVLFETTSVDEFRANTFNELSLLEPKENNFYYFHFYAPHDPFIWKNEYKGNTDIELSNSEKLDEHIKFRRFFLNKMLPLLSSNKFKDCRIIITGDHGYRFYEKKINPNLTNLYLFNFPKINFLNQTSVQDLGYLILRSF